MSSTKHTRRIISTTAGGRSKAPYSQAVQIDQTLYLSGAIGLDPSTGKFAGDTVQEQTRQALKNLGEVLKAAGASYHNVVKVNVFLQDMNDFSAMNEIYAEVFSERYPARSTVQVAGLPWNAKVEIEGIAVMGDIEEQ
ncbi:unnamed protein product [Rotaria magnacalcarata]|uniref:2-iminobutanoate/2-iminopropanoate deaminase n=1 Tax=Rotaria magnacalcarata TaxID=392030 RepID=A0A815SEK9_9BILA|nr:unnamed protein product [Rotaria magnacalcarata]CAF1490924.1 unnamed protein product [Rotaria magnacalcarata]CAF2039695.1 unnamed protein product [Rotaria magnacalcarata]CAF2116508.1 unnamed protein product [Rotaria magnacalcarata]CAF2146155.1 unnamed protein product [Rotaria magnacalcarata]